MPSVVISNALLKTMALNIKREAIKELTGTVRSITLKDVPHTPTITFVEDIPKGAIVVLVWVNKVKIAQQTYTPVSEKPWMTLDAELEHYCYIGLINYFYGVLHQNTPLNAIIQDTLEKGNASVKLPNGQTLRSEVRHGAYQRAASLIQKNGESICSLQANVSELSFGHILSSINFHWTDPGRLCPDDHYIEIESEWFDAYKPNSYTYL